MKNYGRQILRKWNIFRVFFFLLSFCLCAGNLTLTSQAANSASASTVRLSKTEGTVEVSDSAGKAAFYRQDMRLANGDHTVTAERSYAWFSLDDTKVVKEDAVSDVEVRKRGQKLEVLVNSGSLFFNITEPLKEDESLNIRTSTMVMGVRGTCGVIKGVGEGITCLQLLTGHLECIVTNPNTGITKTISLDAGDQAFFYADRPGEPGVSEIVISKLEAGDLDGFVLTELVGDPEMISKIREESGIDLSMYTFDDASARLRRDQAETAAKNHQPLTINNRRRNNGIKDPVWEKNQDQQPDTSGSDDSDGSGSPKKDPEEPKIGPVVTLTMKVTAQEVQDYLNNPDVEQVILEPSSSGDSSDNVLEVDIDLNVPSGKTLTTEPGVYVYVEPTASVTVEGTADLGDNLTNKGMIKVNSSNSLHVSKDILNHGSVVVTSSGLTTVGGKFIGYEGSALSNEGQFEGIISGEGMIFLNRGTAQGDVMGSFENIKLMGGTLTGSVDAVITTLFDLEGGTVNGTVSLSGGEIASIKLISGAITANSGDAALAIEAGDLSKVYLESGTVTNNGSGSAFKYGGSGDLSYSGGTVFQTKEFSEVVEPRIPFWHGGESGDYYKLLEGGNKYTVSLPTDGELSFTLQGGTEMEQEVTEGDEVVITVTNPSSSQTWFPWEARDKDGKLFVADESKTAATGKYSYGNSIWEDGDTEQTITFVMPSFDVDVIFLDASMYTGYFYLEDDTTVDQITSEIGDEGGLLIRAGATSDSFTFGENVSMESADGFSIEFDKDVTINIAAQFDIESASYNSVINSGVLNVSGGLNISVGGSFYNNNKMTIEDTGSMKVSDNGSARNYGTLVNNGSVTLLPDAWFYNTLREDLASSTPAVFDNYGTLTIATGANFSNTRMYDTIFNVFNNYNGASVDNEGNFENAGTFNNYAGATITNRGTIDNISDQTFNNYGTVIQEETAVFNNGDGTGNDGVFNNFADAGVILNSGTIINNDGSIFRNYGTIIEESPDAVSPELAAGSKPVVKYGEDPESVLSGVPDGTVGGQCGETLFWYLEELEEEEAEELRRFTEGHKASDSDAEKDEDDASVSYVLHITGSGAMDDFDLEGGKSNAPWFEELDGAVRAVKIDEGVTQIGKNAFYGIRTLAYVSFAGTDTEWKSVKVQSGNEALDKTVLLFGGDDDLVLGDPLVADDEEVSWTEPEAKPAAAAAGKATASDAEKEEPEEGKKEQGDTEQKPETPETPWNAEPESRKPEEPEGGKSGNGKQDSEA